MFSEKLLVGMNLGKTHLLPSFNNHVELTLFGIEILDKENPLVNEIASKYESKLILHHFS